MILDLTPRQLILVRELAGSLSPTAAQNLIHAADDEVIPSPTREECRELLLILMAAGGAAAAFNKIDCAAATEGAPV